MHYIVYEAEKSIGRHAVRARKRSDTVEGAVYETVAVKYKKFFHDFVYFELCSANAVFSFAARRRTAKALIIFK